MQAQEYRTEVRSGPSAERSLRARSPGAVEVIEVSGDARGRGVAEVLAEATGVQIHSLGGLGRYAQVSIRGSSAQQVAVYLDGVPISGAAGGAVNLADFPLAQLERIEVYRGLPPTWLPGAPAGGAINLVTRAPIGRRRVEAEVGGGSFGARSARLLGQRADERLILTTFAEYQGATGDFDFHDDRGTPIQAADDRTVRRQSNGFDEVSWHTKADAQLADDWSLHLGGGTHLADRELPRVGSINGSSRASLRSRRGQVAADLAHPEQGSWGVDFSVRGERLSDPAAEIGFGVPKDVDGRTLSAGLRRVRRFALTEDLALDGLIVGRYERYDETDLLTDRTSEASERITVDGTLAAGYRPGGASLIVTPEVRASAQSDALAGTSNDARLLVSESLTMASGPVHVTAWSGRRAPTFFERFGNRGAIVGNPALRPERVLGVELGARTASVGRRSWGWSGQAVGFSKRAEDLIQYRQASLQTSRAFNVGRADIQGIELRARLRLGRRLDVIANHTWQRAVDAGDTPHTRGQRLPRTPDHELFVRPRLRLFRGGLVIAPSVAFNSAMVLDPANLHRVGPRTLLGLQIDVALPLDLTLKLTGVNLLDERTEDFQGYPLPGRGVHAALGWRWIGGKAP